MNANMKRSKTRSLQCCWETTGKWGGRWGEEEEKENEND